VVVAKGRLQPGLEPLQVPADLGFAEAERTPAD
jgi:hypothetical protein